MSGHPDDPATRRPALVVFLRLNEHHSQIVTDLVQLAGIENTDALRRMIDHWYATHGPATRASSAHDMSERRPISRLRGASQKRAC